jgi:Glycosyl hydrolases family 25
LRRFLFLGLAGLLLGGCGATFRPVVVPRVAQVCPQAADGRGSMGACTPQPTLLLAADRTLVHGFRATAASHRITFPDLSNNDPCVCGGAIRRAGNQGLIVKVNQGTYYRDPWAAPMVRSARAAGLAVGGYDFVSEYSRAEAAVMTEQLVRAGITRRTARTFPPVLDVEYGPANRAGLEEMIRYLTKQFGRVMIYTASWFWTPHFGSWWPRGVTAWVAGYPEATPLPGLPERLKVAHQFSDHEWFGGGYGDMSVWLKSKVAFDRFVRTPFVETHAEKTRAIGQKIEQTRCRTLACRSSLRKLRKRYWGRRRMEAKLVVLKAERRKVHTLIARKLCRKKPSRLGCKVLLRRSWELSRRIHQIERGLR